jgi:hypothetical protein
MTISEIIASLALAVSCASFIVAYLSFRRTAKLDEPNAWAEVSPLAPANCWTVKVNIKNPTRYPLNIDAISVPIGRIPIDEKQDFLLAPSLEMQSAEPVATYMKMPVYNTTVGADSEGTVEACIRRGALSTASEAILTLHYWAMLERPRYRSLTLRARIPSGGVTLQVSRTLPATE